LFGSIGTQVPSSLTSTDWIRPSFDATEGSKLKRRPATWAKRPPPSSIWLTPFSSEATMSAPFNWKVASVFWNGRTASTSPIVISPASIEARSPPPFWMATWTPWSFTRSSIASATRLPISHSCARQVSRLPSIGPLVSATTLFLSSSIGAPSSAMRASTASSGATEASSSIGSPAAEVTTPSSLKTTLNSPRYFE
jgi:hypothetical protein